MGMHESSRKKSQCRHQNISDAEESHMAPEFRGTHTEFRGTHTSIALYTGNKNLNHTSFAESLKHTFMSELLLQISLLDRIEKNPWIVYPHYHSRYFP